MSYDPRAPAQLKKHQQWFASIITRPVDEESRMNPISPSGIPMEEEAYAYIAPSPTLRPAQRIQIYNQQYWWRLINILHETFPVATRLFGYSDFNQTIAIPYLQKYPPNHWSLSFLGNTLPKWVEESYHREDKKIVWDAVKLDWSFCESFIAAELPTIEKADEKLLSERLFLQPSLVLFELDYDLFQFRSEFLKQEPDYWIENDFPEMAKGKKFYFVLYRNRHNQVTYSELSKAEWWLLKQFEEGTSIENLCQKLEGQGKDIYDEASSRLHLWFQEWTARRWFALKHECA